MRPILSASNLHAAALCPAKPRMEKGLTEQIRPETQRGLTLHPFFNSPLSRGALSPDDREFMENADMLSAKFIAQFVEQFELSFNARQEKEQFFDGPVPGTPDDVRTWDDGDYVAILDLKSGFLAVDEAPSNDQLADYTANVWHRKHFIACAVGIISPAAFGPRLTSALYRAEQMPGVLAHIAGIKARTEDPDARPVAGEIQCRWCKATSICPAWRAKYLSPAVLEQRLAIRDVPNEELAAGARVIRACRGTRGDEWLAELRRRLEAKEIDGFKFRNTGSNRTVTDPLAVFDAVNAWLSENAYGPLSAITFDGFRKMEFGAFETWFKDHTGMSEKKAKERLKDVLASHVVETPKAPAIVEV